MQKRDKHGDDSSRQPIPRIDRKNGGEEEEEENHMRKTVISVKVRCCVLMVLKLCVYYNPIGIFVCVGN